MFVMIARIIAVGSVLVVLAACRQQPPSVPVKQLMTEQVQPAAQTYWDAVKFVSDESGDHEIYPRTEKEWERTRQAAARVMELGERLKSTSYAKDRNEDWREFAQGLVDIAGQAEQAAIAKNRDKVFEVGANLYNVCAACHQAYPPAQTTPSNDAAGNTAG